MGLDDPFRYGFLRGLGYCVKMTQYRAGRHNPQIGAFGCVEADTRDILRDKTGKRLGVYEAENKVTRDANRKIVGSGVNQLFLLLPPG